ncbi:Insulin receptor substrate 1-B [Lamellibrachia satsuma]|nr:Insulin receptor substrate 1-B [Lamellibrachia satsuma]
MKKKWFVLREATNEHLARLEYYDSEKKFNMDTVPKRVIQLKSCFSINAKSDKKNKYAIALYTKDDCFSIVCDTEKERSEWLGIMHELQTEEDDSEEPRPYFEHIWPVTVKPKGLGNGKVVIPTAYRLCLTNQTLSLIRPHEDKSHIVFQL